MGDDGSPSSSSHPHQFSGRVGVTLTFASRILIAFLQVQRFLPKIYSLDFSFLIPSSFLCDGSNHNSVYCINNVRLMDFVTENEGDLVAEANQ